MQGCAKDTVRTVTRAGAQGLIYLHLQAEDPQISCPPALQGVHFKQQVNGSILTATGCASASTATRQNALLQQHLERLLCGAGSIH